MSAKACLVMCTLMIGTTLSGCALVRETPRQRAQRIEPMLAAAGFHMYVANTPAKLKDLKSLTPLKMRYYMHGGELHYWFADPVNCNCIYIGLEKNYQRYQRLRIQEKMVTREEEAAQEAEMAAQQEQLNLMVWPYDPYFF
jgi:hypothetical protein